MGKHLAPSAKHELNFITKKQPRGAEREQRPRHALDGERAVKERRAEAEDFNAEELRPSLESILAEVNGLTLPEEPVSAPPKTAEVPAAEERPAAPAAPEEKAPEEPVRPAEAAPAEEEDTQTATPSSPAEEEDARTAAPSAPAEEKAAPEKRAPERKRADPRALWNRLRALAPSGKEKKPARRAKAPSADAERSVSFTVGHPLVFPVIAVLLLVLVRFLPLEGWMIPAAYAVPALLALADPAADAIAALRRGEFFSSAPISCLAAVLLFALRSYPEAILLLAFTTSVKLLEERLNRSCTEEYAKDLDILPRTAALVTDEGLSRVDPTEVKPGDILFVAAGERIPLDGIITEGITTVDTAAISGQRSPWAVNVGYRVYSGSRNLTSDIKIRVTRPYEQSTGRKLVQLAENAPAFPSEQELSAARFGSFFTPAALALALLAGLMIPLWRHAWAPWLRRAAVLLIAARPLTEGFSIPLLYRRILVMITRDGVFSKGKDCVESLAKTETMVFDKTGTITEGRYSVTDVYPVKMSERQLLTIAAAAESFSRHPIAAAIRESAGRIDERILKSVRIRDIPGRGVSAILGSRKLYVGNAALLEENGIKYNIPARPGTAIHVAVDTRYCGYIIVADKVRRRAFDALETLRVNGVQKLVLLTGDVMSVARPVASRLNFDMLRAELVPDEKTRALRYLMKNNGPRSAIAYVCEGSNISRTMAEADVGIAMGALGSEAALASADMLVMDRDIFKLPRMVALARRVYRRGWENLTLGAAVQLLSVLLGALGVLSPLAAEILSFVTALALLANTLRIKE